MKFPARELLVLPAAVIAYAFVLHWVYAALISPPFSYLGFRYVAPDFEIVMLTVIIAIFTALFLPRKVEKASSIILWLLFVITVLPIVLMGPYTGYLEPGEAIGLGVAVSLTFAGVALGTRGTNRPLRLSVSPTGFWLVLILFSLVTYVLLAITHGLSFRFVSFLDVYNVRDEFNSDADGVGLLSYLIFTQANVVNPVIFARGVYTRRPLYVVFAIVGQIILYSGAGFKTMILAIPAWIIVAILFRARRKKPFEGLTLTWAVTAMMLVSALVDQLSHSIALTSLLARRFIVTPGLLTSAWVDFFSSNPQTHLSYSILAPWLDYPYPLRPPNIIGQYIANQPSMAANANLFADGFGNFGWAGIVGAGVILLVYLRLLDRASVGLPIGLVAVVVTLPAITLSNTSILTAMFSHGLVAAFVLLALCPRDFSLKERHSKTGPLFPSDGRYRQPGKLPKAYSPPAIR